MQFISPCCRERLMLKGEKFDGKWYCSKCGKLVENAVMVNTRTKRLH